MSVRVLIGVVILASLNLAALADNDLAEAYAGGYKLWRKTNVKGPFTGCTVGKVIHFTNGMTFKCSENEDEENARGEVTILKHPKTGTYKVFIDDDDYEGTLR